MGVPGTGNYRGPVPSIESLLTFALAGVVLVLIPGPSVLFIVGRALAHGRRAALTSVAGNTAGAALLVTVVSLGFGALAAESIAVFTVLKLLGAGYLVYLGVHTYLTRGQLFGVLGRDTGHDRRLFWQGLVVGVTNPKALIFFAAILPQFVSAGAVHPALQMLTLGLLFCAMASAVDVLWAVMAGSARQWFVSSPTRLQTIRGTGGLIVMGLGVGVLATGHRQG